MALRLRAILLGLAAALPALAWEPVSPAAVQARIEELQQAWAGKSAEEIAQDKISRARQPRPQWVSRSAWKMELGPVTYYFAVGKAAFPSSVNNAPPRPVGTGRPLDWWYDDMAGAPYTPGGGARRGCGARGRPPPPPATPPPPPAPPPPRRPPAPPSHPHRGADG